MDKNKAMIKFLLQCPTILDNPLFFNFADEQDGSLHYITETDTKKRSYIDGSEQKQYTFSIASYSSVSHNAVIKDDDEILMNENIENMSKVQEILDWIDEQAHPSELNADGTQKEPNFPDFGQDCIIESMETMQSDPDINGIDTSVNPPIARYSVGVRLTYLDNSKKVWN